MMKQLHTGTFLWPLFDQVGDFTCPPLPSSINTEVVIVGGGLSGLLTAFYLWKAHIPFVLIEANKIGYGSTLANTGLVQYCNDVSLPDLRARIGKEQADHFYLQCALAIKDLFEITNLLKTEVGDTHFFWRDSIQYASKEADRIKISQIYNALHSIHLPCELLGELNVNEIFPLLNTIAIRTYQDAEINPFLFVRYLCKFLLDQGAAIYEHAKLTSDLNEAKQTFAIHNTISVKANHIIYTIGYQPQQLEQPLIKPILNRSYVIATKPISKLNMSKHQHFIWETEHPYYYVRSTIDQRLIIGGLDEHMATPNHNTSDAHKRSLLLLEKLTQLYPDLKLEIEFSWNATFAESRDSLPFIGPNPHNKKVSYLCGYGGNGIVYSILGAKLLAEYVSNPNLYQQNAIAHIVKLDR